jgi:type IV secretory pathway VirJ component
MKWLLTLLLIPMALAAGPVRAQNTTVDETFGPFGTVHVYRPAGEPQEVVLFASGDGGWNLGVLDMARALRDNGAMVIGFSTPHYLRSLERSPRKCGYPAGDLEALSQYIQKKHRLVTYHPPMLVGYSSGATLVYAGLAQAPGGTFTGGISLGFSNDLAVTRPLCTGSGLKSHKSPDGKAYDLEPTPLPVPWIALQGTIDLDVSPAATDAFVRQVDNATVVTLPHVGHGFSVERHWMPQYLQAYHDIARQAADRRPPPAPASMDGLPAIEVPAVHPKGNALAIILSGDGGWVSIDKELGHTLSQAGIPVVGFNSLHYFWTSRQPQEMANDLTRIIDHYTAAWGRQRIILVGYSRGADVLPFMVSRLPPTLRGRINLVALLGPGHKTSFEFHVTDWLGSADHGTDQPLAPEMDKIHDVDILCIYGEHDKDNLCPDLAHQHNVTLMKTGGGHHFGGDYDHIANAILAAAQQR